jgi:alkylation response protein AidB-like acyl-CoA dehydrogenase
VDFRRNEEQQRLQQKCRELAADFAIRLAQHDRDASHPIENYRRLRDEWFPGLTVAREWGGAGASFLDHTIADEALGQGCPSTALAFNMHASVVMPLLECVEMATETKQRIAQMVVHDRCLIAGNFSEPITTALIVVRRAKTRVCRCRGRIVLAHLIHRADGGGQ